MSDRRPRTGPSTRSARRRPLTGLYLTFVGLGTTGAVVPAAVPVVAEVLGVPTAALLPAVPALFAGLFVGVAGAPGLTGRVGGGRLVAAGALLQAVSLLGLAAAGSAGAVVAAAAVAGVGFGVAESGGTALTRRLVPTTGRTLTGLTAATAAAAAATPLAVVVAGRAAVGVVLATAAVPHLLAAVALGAPDDARPPHPPSRTRSRSSPTTRRVAAALFCYVGAETLLSGWSAALTQASYGLSPGRAALGTSCFWVLLMTGRLTAVAATRCGVPPRTVLAVCQIGAATGLGAAAVTATVPAAPAVSAALIGVSVALMGPCYALLLGRGVDAVGEVSAGATAATLVAAGALGGTAWAAAVAATPPHLYAVTVTAAACLGMTASGVATGRRRAAGR